MKPRLSNSKQTELRRWRPRPERQLGLMLIRRRALQVRKEFTIDDRRIYLMGHSQGGGGARHITEKYPDIWAGVALLAPALFDVQLTRDSRILKVPLMLGVGKKDSMINMVRGFSDQLNALNVKHEYKEFPGLDHGTVIMGSMPEVFRFFPKHVRPKR